MTYREQAIEVLKIAGRDLQERAADFIPDISNVRDISVWIRIPSKTDDPAMIPEIEVTTNVYPKKELLHEVIELGKDLE